MNKIIGIYDSGVGGLTVLREIHHKFPKQDIIYFADTVHLPYGEKSKDQIINYSRNIIKWMVYKMGVKLIVAACNTSSAVALDIISNEFNNIALIGTIKPIVKIIIKNENETKNETKNENENLNNGKDKKYIRYPKIGIIATQLSANSKIHEQELKKAGFNGDIFSIGCPKLVPMIESIGEKDSNTKFKDSDIENILMEYLQIFYDNEIKTLVYGCTHYPLISKIIEKLLPKDMMYIDPAKHIAEEIGKYYDTSSYNDDGSYGSYGDNSSYNNVQFYCSSDAGSFAFGANKFLKTKEIQAKLVNVLI